VFIASPILIYLGVGTGRDALSAGAPQVEAPAEKPVEKKEPARPAPPRQPVRPRGR